MRPHSSMFAIAPMVAAALGLAAPAANSQVLKWVAIVNNGDIIPGTDTNFNSYNQPGINADGLVVFRARSAGGGGEASAEPAAASGPVHGIFERDMAETNASIVTVLQRSSRVPRPNNLDATFSEFPSTPRIGINTGMIATRGQSTPVWEYTVDGQDTRIGTSGIYMSRRRIKPFTAMSQLGVVPQFSYFQVPNAPAGTKFDQFPGSPSPTLYKIAFKGNWTDTNNVSQTGVYYRNVTGGDGVLPVRLIADTSTLIPNQPSGGTVKFGSTAPPSATAGKMVFVGLDNEDAPTLGGIYLAELKQNSPLTTLIGIGDPVPGVPGQTFTKFGEGLSFDSRYVSFWGAWGTETRSITLYCPKTGNKDLLAYCNEHYPSGYQTTEPVNQGIFVTDSVTGETVIAAQTGMAHYYNFLYWVFSGRPPGTGGGEDFEPPRWRASAFTALSTVGTKFAVAFKATKDDQVTQGIYLAAGSNPLLYNRMVVDTNTFGAVIDPEISALVSATPLMVTAVGIERDAFRDGRLVVSVAMANADASVSWAGLYMAQNLGLKVPAPAPAPGS